MATNFIFHDVESTRREVYVGKGIAPGTALIYGGQPAVSVTGSGDYIATESQEFGDLTISTKRRGGVGLPDGKATIAFNGSAAFDVTGITSEATAFDTIDAVTLERSPKSVYITPAGELTTTATANKFFGIVDFYRGEVGDTADERSRDTVVLFGVQKPEV